MRPLLILSFLLLCIQASAQFDWYDQSSGGTLSLNGICFVNKNTGWICNSSGNVLKTQNRGKTWTTKTTGSNEIMNDVCFVDENNGWICGGSILYFAPNILMHTTDGGETWTEQTAGGQEYTHVFFTDQNNGWLSDRYGMVWRTTDGGQNWIDCQFPANYSNYQPSPLFFINSSTGWVVRIDNAGDGTMKLYKTTNGGVSWSPQTSPFLAPDIFFLNASLGWAVGNDGLIQKTTDGGNIWTTIQAFISEDLKKIAFADANKGWLCGTNGLLMSTSNGGTTWTTVDLSTTESMEDISLFNEENIWVSGTGGKIKARTEYQEICLVTVDPVSNKNVIVWEPVSGKSTASYYVYKLMGSNYGVVGVIPFANAGVYTDMSSNPAVTADRYCISAIDSSGVESRKGPYHQSINLGISLGVPSTNITLNWSQYVDQLAKFTPSWYYIWRGTNPSTLQLYDSVSGAFSNYNDNNVFQTYYYRVAVSKDAACITASKASYRESLSNTDDSQEEGIHDLTNETAALLYPNPIRENETIQIKVSVQTRVDYSLFDITGKLRRSGQFEGGSCEISLRGLCPGVYSVKLSFNQNSVYNQVIIY